MSLRAKLVALVVGLTALVLLGLGAFLSSAFGRWSSEAVDQDLLQRAAAVAGLVEVEDEGDLRLEGDERGDALRDPAHPLRVLGPDGPLGASPAGLPWPDPPAGAEPALQTVTDASGRAWRVATAPVEVGGKHGQARFTVQVAGAASAFAALEGPFRRGLLLALVVALLVGGLGAAALAHASLAPLGRLAAEVDAIGAASLDRRVALDGLDPELRRVAGAFNALLGRLEVAMLGQRQLVARASHALRTPVATIRTRAEVALRREREPAAYREALQEVGVAAVEASGLIAHLLTLSRLDEHQGSVAREVVALAPLAREVARLLAPRAEEGGVTLEVEVAGGLAVSADRAALRELLEALLDNAVHHTPTGGRVGLRATAEQGAVAVRVWDTGPGVPEAERGVVFDRFYRGQAAVASGRPGSGLGLAIVKAIADAHGATVTLGDRVGGGLEVTTVFPRPGAG
ncbi:MAG: HAMP domain-containing protein [Anaeromyxobacter sp.]|nr:HAMP domain-containing protein [Anaeromyxobacter sp.]MBL0277353.1 HAMP domain-containing protein [Anaeromyxobacter sp.]